MGEYLIRHDKEHVTFESEKDPLLKGELLLTADKKVCKMTPEVEIPFEVCAWLGQRGYSAFKGEENVIHTGSAVRNTLGWYVGNPQEQEREKTKTRGK